MSLGSRSEPLPAGVQARLDARMNWERRDRSGGWRVDLGPMAALVARLGRPDRAFEVVHVTGSKGKGSTAALIAAGLRAAGHRVGAYGSPHVEALNERVRIDGADIDTAALARALTEVLDVVDPQGGLDADDPLQDASWFDIVTAAALVAFRDAGVGWAVLEVGLGGRLDSTNVIDVPRAAVITMIALEHTNVLGDTAGAIAREKAGILKAGGRAVTGCAADSEAGRAIAEVAADVGAEVSFVDVSDAASFEERNLRVARAALGLIGQGLVDGLTARVAEAARLPGRMELRRAGDTPVLLDGAHVGESVAAALAEGRRRLGGPVIAVAAVHREKDARTVLGPLADCEGVILTGVPGSGVHREAAALARETREVLSGAEAFEDPAEALRRALVRAEPDGWVFVVGSLYLVGALRPLTAPD